MVCFVESLLKFSRVGGKSQFLSRQMPCVLMRIGNVSGLPALSLKVSVAGRHGEFSPLSPRSRFKFVVSVTSIGSSLLKNFSIFPVVSGLNLGSVRFFASFFACALAAERATSPRRATRVTVRKTPFCIAASEIDVRVLYEFSR